MKRTLVVCALIALLGASPGSAEPEFRMRYPNGVPRAEISGDYRNTRYSISRSWAETGPFSLVGDADILCLGSCFVDDFQAEAGRTYWYRFDLVLEDGTPVRFGPYRATISPQHARRLSAIVTPHPVRGSARVTLFLAGAPGGAAVDAEATLLDLQGRRVRRLFHGSLPGGPTVVEWDGRDGGGRALRSGIYLLRVTTADGRQTVTRVVVGR